MTLTTQTDDTAEAAPSCSLIGERPTADESGLVEESIGQSVLCSCTVLQITGEAYTL